MPTATSEPYSERVCVVILEGGVADDEMRQFLGSVLPIRIVHWENRDYLAVIRNVRPRVIVVVALTDELAQDSAALMACLVARFGPTVLSLSLASLHTSRPHLLVQELGANAQVRVASLEDLQLR